MRVYLTNSDLSCEAGRQLLELASRIAQDGKLDLEEIKELRRWLRANQHESSITAIGYLHEIMQRITADGVIDRDELLDLFMAIERVIPVAHRDTVIAARKKRQAEAKLRDKEKKRQALEKETAERRAAIEAQKLAAEAEYRRANPWRSTYCKVAGVTFENDDGSSRQYFISRCRVGERVALIRKLDNPYSEYATAVVRNYGQQIGYVPEYLAAEVCDEMELGYRVCGLIKDLTGGTADRPIRGVNLLIVFASPEVSYLDFQKYMTSQENELLHPKPWWKFW